MNQRSKRWQDIFIVAAIILLATALRVYRLDELPPGLHFDEAFNATMARNVLLGVERPIFFRQDLTEEPMAIYTTALAFGILGQSAWTLRFVSALVGIAGVGALYFLARALFQSRWIAALSALTLAVLYWHLNFSRLGMEPIFTPLMATLAFAFLWQGLSLRAAHPSSTLRSAQNARRAMTLPFALAGFFFAATLYTYKAALFIPILVGAFILLEIILDHAFWARHHRGLIIFALVAILVYAPLGLYLVAHPDEFFQRPSTVAATNFTIVENIARVAGMFFINGDTNPRSNLPERPALDPFLALGFSIGIAICLARFRRDAPARFLLLWLIVMSLPSILTDFAPHFGRNLAVTPALALIVAFGFASLIEHSRLNRSLFTVRFACSLLIAGFAFSTFSTARDYFFVWGARTGLYDSFDVGIYTLAQKLRDRPGDEIVYITPADPEHYTIRFALDDRDVRVFDGRRVIVLPPAESVATFGIITRADTRTRARLEKFYREARVIEPLDDFTAQPYAIILRVQGAPHIAPEKIVHANFGDVIELIGYDIAREQNAVALTLYWRSRAITRDDYTVFAQLLGAPNPATQSPVWAQADAQPTDPTSHWRVGEIIIDESRIPLPENLPRGEYEIQIGMYILNTGARLPVFTSNRAPTERDSVSIERSTYP
ncbi:MAG: glycosyltransferase family 39 protein [Chloroflexi bacterium]|nr:glycosyltransferase family 39 protein [Chloroflexota bacterium]